ncbi:DUF4444 domain-containing protein [Marivita sp. S2033]|uniref:biotin/lipoate--protein ligase family protein n=1 Tax=Marivita sp. S2033 TaxID=3373187 RepID=UPI00398257F8
MSGSPSFPPLMQGLNAAGADPFEAACTDAAAGCDGGTIVFDLSPELLRAAIVLAPEVALSKAAVMLPLVAVALQNALGALGPSELPVHLEWQGGLLVNGATCGHVRAATNVADPDAVADWLVVGFELQFMRPGLEGGDTPDVTDLASEGCGDVEPVALLESWSRHLMNWINRWEDEGIAPLHREWTGLAHGIGSEVSVAGRSGRFLGLDETLGLLLRTDARTILVPLTDLLEIRR